MAAVLVILEDSSQSQFGGGQRISLEVMKWADLGSDTILIDSVNSWWHQKIPDRIRREILGIRQSNYHSLLFNLSFFYRTLLLLFRFSPLKIYITTRKHILSAFIYKCLRPRVKLVFHVHLLPTERMLSRIFDRLVLSFCQHLIFSSQYTYHRFWFLRGFQAVRSSVSPLPPPKWKERSFDLLIPSDPLVIAYVGRLSREKGVFSFLNAIGKLKLDQPWQALIVGDGQDREAVLERIASSPVRERISYDGITDTDFSFYSRISLLVIPSFYIDETLCLTAVEAMQAGVPVLSSGNGNLGIFFQQGLLSVFESDSPEHMARKIEDCIAKLRERCYRRNYLPLEQGESRSFGAFYEDILGIS
ncbi:MAG: glycosyltransferase [Deltaproteobacteria bacterium]|nr:glycosyltransferase [Deltaproteobacteria bacterium]